MKRPAQPLTTSPGGSSRTALAERVFAIACALVFVLAVGVRLLVWYNTAAEINLPMSGLTAGYEADARTLLSGQLGLFLRGPNPPSDANVLAHPPGYSIFLAAILAVRDSFTAARVVQLVLCAFGPVLILLIAAEFLDRRISWIAGVLAALSPQLAYNSLLLLPDSISVLPILLAVWLLLRYGRGGGWLPLCGCGALLGLSIWFRANTLLLPIFIAVAAAAVLLPAGRRWRVVAIAGMAFLVVAPLTARNAIVFGKFVPVSLASGVTLIEGIGDYDTEGRFGLPHTDMRVIEMETREYNRPDYHNSLFNPDGIERERARTARGFAVIRAHPFWFAGVMVRRATMMLRLERVPAIGAAQPTAEPRNAILNFAGTVMRWIQRPFITAVFLPLALAGFVLSIRRREQRGPLVVIVSVVVYFLLVQSALHTEYRYVLLLPYFKLLFAAVAMGAVWIRLQQVKADRSTMAARSPALASKTPKENSQM